MGKYMQVQHIFTSQDTELFCVPQKMGAKIYSREEIFMEGENEPYSYYSEWRFVGYSKNADIEYLWDKIIINSRGIWSLE